MKLTLELPIWAGETLIGYHADVVVDVMLDGSGRLTRVIVPAWNERSRSLHIIRGGLDGMLGVIWGLAEDEIESGKHDSAIAEYLAEMREAKREYARELQWNTARDSAALYG